ncbi:MAG: NAD-dependent epimerase/dehydratase family protein [Cyclobacteriaceae bacterium]
MEIALITGSSGLIGSECVRFLHNKFDIIVGVDNDQRSYFFGKESSTNWMKKKLCDAIENYRHHSVDIRHYDQMEGIFNEYGSDIKLVIHTAAQPSHDWAAKEPLTDYSINSTGTINLLELTRKYCYEATFIFTSTNKVYGDSPNSLPLIEKESRWEIDSTHTYFENGIDETMSIDRSKHSLFGASKVSADIMVQEYGRYFNMKTGVFRGGCLTGPNHSSAQLHGFLSYLVKCCITKTTYSILGYKGKQVRDNIHSWDLVNMFWHYHTAPRHGEVYNAGGGRWSNCSILEAIDLCESISNEKMSVNYTQDNRIGDHIWWISDVSKFKAHFPGWDYKYSLANIIEQIFEQQSAII